MGRIEVLCSLLSITLIVPCGGLMCYHCVWFRDTQFGESTPACLEEDQLMNVPSLLVTCDADDTLCSTTQFASGGDIQIMIRECRKNCSVLSPYSVECCSTDGCLPAVDGSISTTTTTTPASSTVTPTLAPTTPQETATPTVTPTVFVATDPPSEPTTTPTVPPVTTSEYVTASTTTTPTTTTTSNNDAGATTTPTVDAGATTTPTVDAGATTTPTVDAGATTTPTVDAGATTTPTVPVLFTTPTTPREEAGVNTTEDPTNTATVALWTTPLDVSTTAAGASYTTPGDGATEGAPQWTTPGDGTTTTGSTDGEYLECYVCAWYLNVTDATPLTGQDCRSDSVVRQDSELRVRCQEGHDRCQVAVTNDNEGTMVSYIRACSTAESCQGDDAAVDYTCCTTHGCNVDSSAATRESDDNSASTFSGIAPLLLVVLALVYHL